MAMTHRERLETAWSFREPDRVPVELYVSPKCRNNPKAARLIELAEEHADNFRWVPAADFGFFGFPSEYVEETIEEVPGEYKRMRRTHQTEAGTFTAFTYHPEGMSDYHWEKRYISTPGDLRRLIDTPRPPVRWDRDRHVAAVKAMGDKGVPVTGLLHPLGALVRQADMEEVFIWMYGERELMHRFLESANSYIVESVDTMLRDGLQSVFYVVAHEMLIPPWMGRSLFEEFVFPYDKWVNDRIHALGGRLRAHCHGNCMHCLELFAEMGVDAVEPLEHPPTGDVDLAEAKRLVGGRILLSGNIASEHFISATPEEVRSQVKEAIRAAAPGGGYTLHTSGMSSATGGDYTEEEEDRVYENCEAYVTAALEYGTYPLKL